MDFTELTEKDRHLKTVLHLNKLACNPIQVTKNVDMEF